VKQGGRKIVPVFDAPFPRVARAHAIAAVIKDPAGQKGLGLYSCGHMIVRLFIPLGLNGIE
jgi:hypothetical protein